MGRKQPKTCVWVSAVGRERNFAKVSGLDSRLRGNDGGGWTMPSETSPFP